MTRQDIEAASDPAPSARAVRSVVVVSPGGTVGGGGTGSVSREIQQWLVINRQDIDVAVLDPRGVGSAFLWPLYLARALVQLIGLRLGGADLLHIQVTERSSFIRKGIALHVGRLLGMRTMLHHHGASLDVDFAGYSRLARRWLIGTARAAHLNVALGERGKQFLMRDVGVPEDRIVILPNAINDVGGEERPARVAGQTIHYLLMANLSPRKGVSEFLQAMRRLKDEGRAVHATLAGGEEVARYQKEAVDLGMERECTFTGWVKRDRVAELLRDADVLVLPSYHEVLPMVILEALSARIPVITTPVGSIPEVLTNERDCLLVQPGSVDELAVAMRRVADDEALYRQLADNGRALYEERFEMSAYMTRLLAIYERVLNE